MDAHSDAQRAGCFPWLRAQRALGLDGGRHCVVRGCKCRVKPVARRLHDVSAVPLDSVTDQLVVASQRALHCLRLVLPEPRRALEVREQEGDGPGRQRGHTRSQSAAPLGVILLGVAWVSSATPMSLGRFDRL